MITTVHTRVALLCVSRSMTRKNGLETASDSWSPSLSRCRPQSHTHRSAALVCNPVVTAIMMYRAGVTGSIWPPSTLFKGYSSTKYACLVQEENMRPPSDGQAQLEEPSTSGLHLCMPCCAVLWCALLCSDLPRPCLASALHSWVAACSFPMCHRALGML